MANFPTVSQIRRSLKQLNKRFLTPFLALVVLILYLIINQPENNLKSNPVTKISTLTPMVNLQTATVKRVIDGDTIQLENNQIVRYIGIDTPEFHDPRKPVECFAQEAYELNKNLVEGKTVRLEKDISETDKYKRLLRYVYVKNESSPSAEIFLNLKLVQEGFAYTATFPPDVKFAELFHQAQEEAMKNNKGLWKSCKN